MARERALPDLKTRVRVNRKDLDELPGHAKKSTSAVKKELTGSEKAAKDFEQRIGKVSNALQKMGPPGQAAGNALHDVGDSVGTIGLVAGGATAGLLAIAGAAAYGERKYEELANQIDDYQDVTNSSAEQASRMVHVANVLGVSVDTLSGSMFKLSRSVAENPGKLEELGIQVKKDAAGNVDLTETLFSVSDAYNAAGDSSTKTRILFAAFGKSGTEMIDVVELGSARLRQLAKDAKLVLSDDDIQRARDYKIHQDQIKSGWDEWWAALGQKVQPALDAVQVSILKGTYVEDKLNEAVKEGKLSQDDLTQSTYSHVDSVDKLKQKYSDEYDQLQKTKEEFAKTTATIKAQEDENKRLVDSMNQVVDALQAEENASLGARRADLQLADSNARVRDAQQRYADAVKKFGKNSAEAHQALRDYQGALLDQEQAYFDAAEAAKKLQQQRDLEQTGYQDVTAEAKAYIDKLQAEANSLAPGSPLRKRLQDYINQLKNELPRDVYTTLHLIKTGANATGKHPGGGGQQEPGYAAGGRPPVDAPSWVGERGPELFVPDRPGTIIPAAQAAAAAAGQREDQIFHITIDAPVILDGHEIGRVVDRRVARMSTAVGAV